MVRHHSNGSESSRVIGCSAFLNKSQKEDIIELVEEELNGQYLQDKSDVALEEPPEKRAREEERPMASLLGDIFTNDSSPQTNFSPREGDERNLSVQW